MVGWLLLLSWHCKWWYYECRVHVSFELVFLCFSATCPGVGLLAGRVVPVFGNPPRAFSTVAAGAQQCARIRFALLRHLPLLSVFPLVMATLTGVRCCLTAAFTLSVSWLEICWASSWRRVSPWASCSSHAFSMAVCPPYCPTRSRHSTLGLLSWMYWSSWGARGLCGSWTSAISFWDYKWCKWTISKIKGGGQIAKAQSVY